jgi:hypothetical protein
MIGKTRQIINSIAAASQIPSQNHSGTEMG